MQEVAVIQGLQAEITELQIALRIQFLGQTLQIKLPQARIQQFCRDTLLDELRKIGRITCRHIPRRDLFAQRLAANGIQQQARGDKIIGRLFFDQRTRGKNQTLAHFVQRHTIVQILERQLDDRICGNHVAQTRAGILHQRGQAIQIERTRHPILAGDIDNVHRLFALGLGAGTRPLFAVQHVGARNVVLAGTHQTQLDLILNVLDVHRPAMRLAAHQRRNDAIGQLLDHLANARRCRTLTTVHRDERLGQRNRNLGRLKDDHRTIAADYFVLIERIGRRRRR